MHPPFLIGESLHFGWQKMRAHSGVLFGAMLTLFAVQVAYSLVTKVLAQTLEGTLAAAALAVVGVVLGVGFTRMCLSLAQGGRTAYGDIVPPWRLVVQYVVATIYVGLIILVSTLPLLAVGVALFAAAALLKAPAFVGIVLLVLCVAAAFVALVYVAVRYSLVRFAALDGRRKILELVRTSALHTRGVKWRLLGLLLVLLMLNLLGALCLLVGLLVSVPVTTLAYAHAYQKLRHRAVEA